MRFIKFSIRPCIAVIVRHLLEFKNFFEIFMFIYWSFFDLLCFGLLAASFNQAGALQLITTNLALWYLVARGSIGFSLSFVRDLHNVNFASMMTTPLTLMEWIVSLMTLGAVHGVLGFLVSSLVAKLLFGVNVFAVGWIVVPAAVSLICSGWVMGTLVLSIVLMFGRRAESYVWISAWLFSPFSGVFCPLGTLPVVLQKIAEWVPMSYVFACLGQSCGAQGTAGQLLLKSFALNGLYFGLALILFRWRFAQRRIIGLTRLEVEL